ncbi:MAG: CoA transferase [Betaproteobacteria bacterium]|nr:CoA transferase [Betaproteobacteria bacterium]
MVQTSQIHSNAKPLQGVRVLEFCQIAAGPFAGMLLADYGAEVVKIEPPEGDAMRQWPPVKEGMSENFASLNRGKRSLSLNLKDPKDLARAQALILQADVVLENSRPGVMNRLGIGPDWALAQKPGLIYCSISAFGQTGPRGQEGGFDVTIQAASGVMSVTGEPDGAPVKCGVPIADFTAGLYAAFSISAMLARVRAGGPGGQIDVPMFATSLAIAALQTSEYFGTGRDPKALGSAHPRNAPYQAYRAADDYFVIAAGNNKLWASVCEVVDLPALLADDRFATTTLRAQNQAALKGLLEEQFAKRNAADWVKAFQDAGVPCSPIQKYSQALQDPQAIHLQLVNPQQLPGHQTKTVGCPVWLSGQPVAVDTSVETLGQSNDQEQPWRSL